MRIYPVLFLFTMILIVLLNNGCKKNEDPVRIATYELDSIEIVQLNNSGDTVMRFALGLAPNNIDSIMSFLGPFYRFNGDSIVYDSYENPYNQNYNYSKHLALNNKLVSVVSNYDHSHIYRGYTSVFKYSNSGNIDSVNTMMDLFDSGPRAEFTLNRKLNYTNGNITSLTETIHSFFYNHPSSGADSINDKNSIPTTFNYTHNYPSQKDLIGLDVNDIIFDLYRCIYLNNYPNGIGFNNASYFSGGIIQVLVLANKVSLNTNCNNLIEGVNFEPLYLINATDGIEYSSVSFSLNISYHFDSVNNNRITQMVVEAQPTTYSYIQFGKVIYNFKYAN